MAQKKFRNNGAKGAILDEYERAIADLKQVIADVKPEELVMVIDPGTSDPDCKSIQTILTHVVRSAFGYATYIRKHCGDTIEFRPRKTLPSVAHYMTALDAAFDFTEETFEMHPGLALEAYNAEKKFKVRWGQLYDVEQIMEHAIVHVLRHRRQIEGFMLKLRG